MKNFLKIMLCFLFPFTAFSQGTGSHGGDTIVIEFSGTQQNLSNWYSKKGPIAGCEVSPESLFELIQGKNHLILKSKPKVFTDGYEQDAITYPHLNPPLTELSRTRLIEKEKDVNYLLLTLHEAFVALSMETTNDTVSSKRCLDAMLLNGLHSEEVIVHYKPFGSITDNFNRGLGFLDCQSEGSGNLDLNLQVSSSQLVASTSSGVVLRSIFRVGVSDYYNMLRGEAEIRSKLVEASQFNRGQGYESKQYWIELSSTTGLEWIVNFTGRLNNLHPALSGMSQQKFHCNFLYGQR